MAIWGQVRQLAAQTPEDRNRYVDFLRAVSILVVIVGHWLIATSWYVDGELISGHLLKSHPQTQWLTWLFQVMPIFFIVGGYSNAVSLESARRSNIGYAGWLVTRLNRLVAPLLVLVIAWALLGVVMGFFGVDDKLIQFASQASLIPTWFLAIYIMVVILAPWTYRWWQQYGFASFWAFVAVAILVDTLFFVADMRWLGWSNYFWVWLSVHHLGYAWRDGRLGSPARLLLYSAIGIALLATVILRGPYPLAMVGSPDEGLSNTLPPKATLLALAIFQFGLLLSLEKPMRRVLSRLNLWAATVLINTMIMTVYLWHITVMIILIALLVLAGGFGLGLEPGTPDWWYSRPLWILVLICLLTPVALLMSPLERRPRSADAGVPSPARQITGAMMLCLGIALLAMYGYGGGPIAHLDVMSFALVIIGAGVSGLLASPLRKASGAG
jgi:peptidoglycan/LPS O-acetylase OafA/YrhL